MQSFSLSSVDSSVGCFISVVKTSESSKTCFNAAETFSTDNEQSKLIVRSNLFLGEQLSSDFFFPLYPKSPLLSFKFFIFTGATFLLHGSQVLALEVHDGLFSPSLTAGSILKSAVAT